MIMLDDITALVFDTDDLRDAVNSDNGVEYVYFGADITLAYGITIFSGKPRLIFDGTYEGVTYTFTDMNRSTTGDTIGIRSFSTITITFKNINLIGRNYYGIPYIPSGDIYSGVSTIYENVTYTGTQINYNPHGFTRFTDCNITVNNNEAAEANGIEIGGMTTILKTNDANAVFWFRGSSSHRPYLRILTGANVTITTAFYFMYESYSPDFILEPGANLAIDTRSGICLDGSHTVNSFLVDENASFRFTQAVSRAYPAIYIDGALTVNDGASFYMQADYSNSTRLIRFTGSSGGLFINNPKSFVLYNRGNSSATAFYFVSTIPITLSGGQLNYWENSKEFPTAGTLEDTPLHKWNRPSYERFTLKGTANNTATNITFNDFTPEEMVDLPPFEDLHLYKASALSIGSLPLTIYSAVITRSVTGETEPYANLKVVFLPSYFVDPNTDVADGDGLFAIIPTAPMPFSDYIEVFSNIPFLIVSSVKLVREEGVLGIDKAPVEISFPFKPITELPGIILPRDDSDSSVTIVDTRDPKTDWQLWVNISSPLMTEENDVLTDAVVFILENGEMETLGTEFKAIHTDQPFIGDDKKIIWDQNEGLLVRISVPIRSGKQYTTQLGWVVTPLGVRPEDME